MSNEISQEGFGHLAFQGVENSTINISQQLGKSSEYKKLLDELKTLKDFFSYIPEDELKKRFSVSKQINQLEGFIENFKQDVLKLADQFTRIEINTERLVTAKGYFDEGDFEKSRNTLESEIDRIKEEQKRLLSKKNEYLEDILPKLKNNADEFLILALSASFDYNNPDRFQNTCHYFESSIESFETLDNLIDYTTFLHKHKSYQKAEKYYLRLLRVFEEFPVTDEKIFIYNRLGSLYRHQLNFERSEEYYAKALEISTRQAESRQSNDLMNLAVTLNNFGNLLGHQNKFAEAAVNISRAKEIAESVERTQLDIDEIHLLDFIGKTANNLANVYRETGNFEKSLTLYEEALAIRKSLAEQNYLQYANYVGNTLDNIGILRLDQEKFNEALAVFDEALKIFRNLAKENPVAYLPELAFTLRHAADSRCKLGDLEKAGDEYNESWEILYVLMNDNPKMYQPHIASHLVSLARYYQDYAPSREESIFYAALAVRTLSSIYESLPFTQRYMSNAINILRNWGLTPEQVEEEIKNIPTSYPEKKIKD